MTQREFPIGEGETLLSTTDLKGRIVYANEAFLRVSGFDREELYGKAHNVVRHPDMPEQAFEDMWRTIQGGRTWTALVKNRRKNGDHYWVRANATPMRSLGRVVGYLSVRTRPTPEEVSAHEGLYRKLREGSDEGLGLQAGFVVRSGPLGRVLRSIRFLSVSRRIQLAVAAPVAAGVLALAAAATSSVFVLPASVGFVIVGMAAALWLIRDVAVPLQDILAQARQVASGQPAQSLYRRRGDEIGELMRAIEQAGLNVVSLVDDVRDKGQGIELAAQELRKGNDDLSNRTEEAASSLEQSAAALEELAATVRSNRDTAQSAAQLADNASGVARDGAQLVGRVVEKMEGIHESSKRIAEIVSLIDGVAFQTNILALNAAVEAARAGEHGRGFAVVAGEVRALSQKSAGAARDIRMLIEASRGEVESGMQAVTAAGASMGDLTRTVESLTTMIREISVASSEQATGIEQVSAAVGQLDRVTQQNAALVEQSAAATGNLNQQARRLGEAVAAFRPSGTASQTEASQPRNLTALEAAT